MQGFEELFEEYFDVFVGELVIGVVVVEFADELAIASEDEDNGDAFNVPEIPPGFRFVVDEIVGDRRPLLLQELKDAIFLVGVVDGDRHECHAPRGVFAIEFEKFGELFATGQTPGRPGDEDVKAVIAYLTTLKEPAWPLAGLSSESIARGKAVFESEKAGCANCHPAPLFANGESYDVGTGSPDDVFPTYNTPSLRGVGRRNLFLHDGRAKTLRDALTGAHRPSKMSETADLTDGELVDLIAYLMSI